jgi:hypothetical protein
MKFAHLASNIENLELTSIINPVASDAVSPGSLPQLTPLSASDPLYSFFQQMYEKINSDPNEEATVRLQISIMRSIYQNKVKYFSSTKKSLIALSLSDDMLKYKVRKIHKETYSKLGTQFGALHIHCIRKMSGYIPAAWTIAPNSVFASWKHINSIFLKNELASVIGANSNLNLFSFTDAQVEQMTLDELELISSILTPNQNCLYTYKQIDTSDI